MKGATLIDYLKSLAERDAGATAALSRSLAFDPGTYPPAFPALERLVSCLDERERKRAYLIAALWARYGRKMAGQTVSLAGAFQALQERSMSSGARFTTLLDSDGDELNYRLRQAVALVAGAGFSIDFAPLYDDLQYWSHPDKWIQQRWARQFFAPRGATAAVADGADPSASA